MPLGVAEVRRVELHPVLLHDGSKLYLEGDSRRLPRIERRFDVVDLENELGRADAGGGITAFGPVEGDPRAAGVEEREARPDTRDLEAEPVAIELDGPAEIGDAKDDVGESWHAAMLSLSVVDQADTMPG